MRRKEQGEKGRTASRRGLRILLTLLLISICSLTVQAESESKIGIFILYGIKDEDTAFALSAAKIQDMETGCSYLVSSELAGIFEANGYDLYLLQGDFQEKVKVVGTQAGLSFLRADGIGDYVPCVADRTMAPDMEQALILGYDQEEQTLTSFEEDMASWQKTDSGWYDSGMQADSLLWACGCPVVNKESFYAMGILSADIQDDSQNSSIIMIDLSQTELNPEWMLENAGQSKEDTDEGTDEGSDEGSGEDHLILLFVVFLIVIILILFFAKMRKPPKSEEADPDLKKQSEKQPVVRQVEEPDKTKPAAWQVKEPDKTKPAEGGSAGVGPSGSTSRYCLIGVEGNMKGRTYDVRGICWIGRSKDCQISYPDDTRGISGWHCEVIAENGKLFLMDVGSTYGTYMGDGEKLTKNKTYELKEGDNFYLADRKQMFLVCRKG